MNGRLTGSSVNGAWDCKHHKGIMRKVAPHNGVSITKQRTSGSNFTRWARGNKLVMSFLLVTMRDSASVFKGFVKRCVFVCEHTCECMFVYVCVWACECVCLCMYLWVCINVCVRVYLLVGKCMCWCRYAHSHSGSYIAASRCWVTVCHISALKVAAAPWHAPSRWSPLHVLVNYRQGGCE